MNASFGEPLQGDVAGTADLRFLRIMLGLQVALGLLWGISMLWLFSRYGHALDLLPERAARTIWSGLDRAANRWPQHSDMIISVWRKPDARPWPTKD